MYKSFSSSQRTSSGSSQRALVLGDVGTPATRLQRVPVKEFVNVFVNVFVKVFVKVFAEGLAPAAHPRENIVNNAIFKSVCLIFKYILV